MGLSEIIQAVAALANLVLALLTWQLARSTKVMAGETRRLADQAARQLANVEQSRQDSVRPVVVITLTDRHPGEGLKSVIRSTDFRIRLTNVGAGPALQVEAEVLHGGRSFAIKLDPESPRPLVLPTKEGQLLGDFYWEFLEDGPRVREFIRAEQSEGRGGLIRVTYRDILGGDHLTMASLELGQEFFGPNDRLSELGPTTFQRTD